MLGAILLFAIPIGAVVFLIACLCIPWMIRQDFAAAKRSAGEKQDARMLYQQLEEWTFRVQQHQVRYPHAGHADKDAWERREADRLLEEGKWHMHRLKQWLTQHGLDTAEIERAQAEVARLDAKQPR